MSTKYKIWHNRFDRLVELDLAKGRLPEDVVRIVKTAQKRAAAFDRPMHYYDAFMMSGKEQPKEYALKRRDAIDRIDEREPRKKIGL